MQDEILQKYEIRKSNKEKTSFIEYMKNRLEYCGYDVNIEEKGFGLFKSRNIVIGDPEKAKVIIGAHYDTCALLPFPNLMTPTCTWAFWGYQVVLSFMLLGVSGVISFIIGLLTKSYMVASTVNLITLLLMAIQIMFGFANKHTANDNTSGIITLTHILETLSKEDREKICVVYFDNEEKGLFGSSFFAHKHKKVLKNKLMINFDCVGDGDHIISVANKKCRDHNTYKKFVEALKTETGNNTKVTYLEEKLKFMLFPSDQMKFKNGVGVCALHKGKLCYYAARIHTWKDTICDEENINFLTGAMTNFSQLLGN